MVRIVVLLLLLFCLNLAAITNPGISVEIDSSKAFPTSISLENARIQVLEMMRSQAIEKALPRDITISSLTTDMYVETNARFDEQTARSIYMMSSMAGRIIEEKILEDYPKFEKNSKVFNYHMRYQARVHPLDKSHEPGLALGVNLSNNLLKDGDEFDLTVSSEQDGYLYIFNFLPDHSVALVLPTLSHSENRLKAGKAWKQKLSAVIEAGKEHSIETLYFVFSTEPINGWESFRRNENATDLVFSAGEESYTLFQRWLTKSDPAKRAEKMLQLHIFR